MPSPVFADVDPDTWCLDPDELEKAISERTRAVVPVHLGARMADMDRIMALARRYSLPVIEDCAHMHGGFWRDRGAGSIGDLGCFSFQTWKLMTAGEGGMILTGDEELEERCQSYINCGRVRPNHRYVSPQEILGWNCRITEFQAAILLVHLERLPQQVKLRAENTRYLTDRLREIEGVATLKEDKRMTVRSGYGFLFKYCPEACGSVPRDTFVAALQAEGIPASGALYEPVYRSPLFGWREAPIQVDYSETRCPVAERAAYTESVWLPHQLFLGTRQETDDIAAADAGKHVICEKPVALNLEECDAMIEACLKAGVLLLYAEQCLFAPTYVHAKTMADEGALGRVYYVRHSWCHVGPHADWFWDVERSGGGALMDVGCHSIALTRWVFDNAPIESVSADLGTFVHGGRTDGEDHSVCVLRFSGDRIALVENSWTHINGVDERAELNGSEGLTVADLSRDSSLTTGHGWTEEICKRSFLYEMGHFVRCIRGEEQPRSTGEDGRSVLEAIMAAYASAGRGERVSLAFAGARQVKKPIDEWRT